MSGREASMSRRRSSRWRGWREVRPAAPGSFSRGSSKTSTLPLMVPSPAQPKPPQAMSVTEVVANCAVDPAWKGTLLLVVTSTPAGLLAATLSRNTPVPSAATAKRFTLSPKPCLRLTYTKPSAAHGDPEASQPEAGGEVGKDTDAAGAVAQDGARFEGHEEGVAEEGEPAGLGAALGEGALGDELRTHAGVARSAGGRVRIPVHRKPLAGQDQKVTGTQGAVVEPHHLGILQAIVGQGVVDEDRLPVASGTAAPARKAEDLPPVVGTAVVVAARRHHEEVSGGVQGQGVRAAHLLSRGDELAGHAVEGVGIEEDALVAPGREELYARGAVVAQGQAAQAGPVPEVGVHDLGGPGGEIEAEDLAVLRGRVHPSAGTGSGRAGGEGSRGKEE